jgi:predicted phosphoribosyltransferase
MSESDQNKGAKEVVQSQMGSISKGMSELLITDIFNKHRIAPEQLRKLTAEQKQEIMNIVQDLKRQVDQFMAQGVAVKKEDAPAEKSASASKAISAPAPMLAEAAPPRRKRRFVLRKDR